MTCVLLEKLILSMAVPKGEECKINVSYQQERGTSRQWPSVLVIHSITWEAFKNPIPETKPIPFKSEHLGVWSRHQHLLKLL